MVGRNTAAALGFPRRPRRVLARNRTFHGRRGSLLAVYSVGLVAVTGAVFRARDVT